MSDRHSSLALREWRTRFTDPKVWGTIFGVAAILTLVGPFETEYNLRIGPRFAYWVCIAASTYSVGVLVGAYLTRRLAPPVAAWVRIGTVMLSSGLGVTAVVYMINSLTFGNWLSFAEAPLFLINVFAISSIISALFEFLAPDGPAPAVDSPPAILDRLPFDKRGPLVSLSVQDHYVDVTTTKGSELVLMRLSDAIKETSPVNGLQTHRSYWVAIDAVTSVSRHKERAILTLSSGRDIPVSRSYLPALRAAGLV